jgi:hypothetical protein
MLDFAVKESAALVPGAAEREAGAARQVEAVLLAAALDHFDHGMLLLDPWGAVLYLNRAGQAAIAAHPALCLQGGRLHTASGTSRHSSA